jgi:hypothetical protein
MYKEMCFHKMLCSYKAVFSCIILAFYFLREWQWDWVKQKETTYNSQKVRKLCLVNENSSCAPLWHVGE